MDRIILSEINRIREIMGMSLIMEAAGPGQGILDLIFGTVGKTGDEFAEALAKNIDDISDPIMRDVVEKMKSSIDNNLGEFGGKSADEVLEDLSAISRGESRTLQGLDELLSKVQSEILSNPTLSVKYIDNLLDTYPTLTDIINDAERNSLLKSLKDEFPDKYKESLSDIYDQIEKELDDLGVSNSVIRGLYDRIEKNIDSSVQNFADDFEEQLDELPNTPDPEIPEIPEIKGKVATFESARQEFLKEIEGIDREGIKAFLESKTLPDVTKKIEGKSLAELDYKTAVELFYLKQYGLLSTDAAKNIMNRTVPEWTTIWNSYQTWQTSYKTTNPSFSKWFLKTQNGYLKIPWLKKLSVISASKSLQLFTSLGKSLIGKYGANTAITSWLLMVAAISGGGYYAINVGDDIIGGQDAGRQAMMAKNNLWKTMFNEFITDKSETIETYNDKNEMVGSFSILSNPSENTGIDGIDNLEGSIIGWTNETDPIIQTKKPLTLNGVPYYYFIIDAPNRLGLERFGTDLGYTLKAYVNNPSPAKSNDKKTEETTGAYKDELESFKTWYVSRGDDYKNVDMSAAGKDDAGFYLNPESTKRYTIKSDFSAFDKKEK